jgi:hypothetical protein
MCATSASTSSERDGAGAALKTGLLLLLLPPLPPPPLSQRLNAATVSGSARVAQRARDSNGALSSPITSTQSSTELSLSESLSSSMIPTADTWLYALTP